MGESDRIERFSRTKIMAFQPEVADLCPRHTWHAKAGKPRACG